METLCDTGGEGDMKYSADHCQLREVTIKVELVYDRNDLHSSIIN